jgi:hypothetical protein
MLCGILVSTFEDVLQIDIRIVTITTTVCILPVQVVTKLCFPSESGSERFCSLARA